jgi:hypothetical protein
VSSRATAIAALAPRRRAVVAGEVEAVVYYQRPWVRTDAVLGDGTGTLVLRFMGRAGVPGIAAGVRLAAEGTPALDRGRLVMCNPLYSFLTAE